MLLDRNTDVGTDDDCLDAGGSARYTYHQEANYRVVALTDEDGAVIERCGYTAYGEPLLYAGDDGGGSESGRVLAASAVGNPFLHQGLHWDAETGTYQNRFRVLHGRLGRFMQPDPLPYADSLNLTEYLNGRPISNFDSLGLRTCEEIIADLIKAMSDALKEQTKWDEQRLNPPSGTNYPGGCIDRGHQIEQNNRFQQIRKLLWEWNENNCSNRYPKANPHRSFKNILDEYKKIQKVRVAPKPANVPWWVPVVDKVIRQGHEAEDTAWAAAIASAAVLTGGAAIAYGPSAVAVIGVAGAAATPALADPSQSPSEPGGAAPPPNW